MSRRFSLFPTKMHSKYIDVEVAVDELATTGPEMRNLATYGAIKQYCLDNHDMKVTTLYITQVKHKCGLPLEAEAKRQNEARRQQTRPRSHDYDRGR